jgi:uncharacterized protein (UPF0333 family)
MIGYAVKIIESLIYFFCLLLITLFLVASPAIIYYSSSYAQATTDSTHITYNSSEKVITITCKAANLTGIYNQLKDPGILRKEANDGVWLLNSGITIEKDSILYIVCN